MLTACLSTAVLTTEAGYEALPAGFSGAGQGTQLATTPISMELVDVSLVDFLRVLADLNDVNILVDPEVEGRLTLRVKKVPWGLLLESVLQSNGLTWEQHGNLLRILTRDRQRQEALAALESNPPGEMLQIRVHHLNHAVAENMRPILSGLVGEGGSVDVDSRTNTLILRDVTSRLDSLTSLAQKLDSPEPQVEIEARIIEATTRFAREIGLSLGLEIGTETSRNRATARSFTSVAQSVGLLGLNSGTALDTVRLDALIAAAEESGEARILSRPRVSTQNKAQAIITQGAKMPIPVEQNFTTTVRFETAALQLTVTPQVTDRDGISMAIKVENNIPDFSRTVLGIPTILTSESQTRVLLPDGGTTVIGGILVEIDRNRHSRLPALSRVPLVGRIFRYDARQRETREILFFITPRIKR